MFIECVLTFPPGSISSSNIEELYSSPLMTFIMPDICWKQKSIENCMSMSEKYFHTEKLDIGPKQ